MRYFKNRTFQHDLKDNDLDDEDIKTVIGDILKGRAVSLGSKLYKIRGSIEGKGKSGGFRTIFFWRKEEFVVFCSLFTKNERDNLHADDFKVLKVLSREYEIITQEEISKRIGRHSFTEIIL